MNEVALITGAAGGIGQAICERLLARGMRLVTEFGSRDALITSYADKSRLAKSLQQRGHLLVCKRGT